MIAKLEKFLHPAKTHAASGSARAVSDAGLPDVQRNSSMTLGGKGFATIQEQPFATS
ncbi:MAG: hypothetical protein Q8S26_16020 [Azonexus sp.]|nr:hypothetical protein [Azonexus sp.]